MEDPKLIADLLNGDKVLHTIEANTGKKIVFMHTLMNVEQKVYSYFLDQIQLEPVENANINNAVDLKEFNATVKDMLRKDYIEHNETVKEMSSFVLDFVQTQLKNFQANVSTHTMPIKKALYDTAIAFKEFKAVFFYIYGPEEVSLKTLKTEIDKLASMSDDAFLETLFKYSSVSVPKSIFITVKNNIVKAYQHYFKKVEENLNTAQRLLPALMIDDFDAYRTQVAKFMNKDPQRKQARYVLELLRLHALYPHYQSVIAPLISKKCEAKPIDTNNDFFGIGKSEKSFINLDEIQMTLPINLAQIAGELRQEGLQPPYVQSMQVNGQIVTPPTDAQKRSFENTIKIFLGADDILREFEHCFKSRQYQERKYKQIAAKKGENVLRKAKTLADYIAAFQLMAP